MITKEEMDFLSRYENNFICALRADYTRAIPNVHLKRMVEIYEREKGINKYNICYHCSSSILRFVKAIGVLYNENKEKNGKQTIQTQGNGEDKVHKLAREQESNTEKTTSKGKAKAVRANKNPDSRKA